MTKQEWREKAGDRFAHLGVATSFGFVPDEGRIADFFYSLHLQEIEKIREMIKSLPYSYGTEDKEGSAYINRDDILLAITDEKI